MLEYKLVKETIKRVSKMKEKSPNLWWKSQVRWNHITVKLAHSTAAMPFDSFPIGVSADSCSTGVPWLWSSKGNNQQNL